jgi:surfeit locus 1 family protein
VVHADTIAYPWEGNLNNWEGRRVEFEGYYKDDRFIVAREKDGKPGYLVFAPFVTHGSYRGNSSRKSEFSIIVCLGWIPRNHKDRIISDREKFADESVEQDDSEEESVPMTKVTGVLRPTEKFNLLKGAVNWESRNSYKFIDLFLISRFFRIYNIDAASTAYLQRVVDT